MITDTDTIFDRNLRRWLADGDERAPARYVEAALIDVAATPQRRPTFPGLSIRASSRHPGRSLAAGLVVGMLLLAGLIAIAVGGHSGPTPSPSDTNPPPSTSADATVEPTPIASIVEGFPVDEPVVPSQTYRSVDGTVEMTVPGEWQRIANGEWTVLHLTRARVHVWVLRGEPDGRFKPCLGSVGAWEDCSEMHATTLEELVASVEPEIVSEHGIGAPRTTRDHRLLDGEPGAVTVVEAYEYPARGPEFVAYIVAMHDRTPVVVRIWTSNDRGIGWLDEIITGFRFLD